MNDQDDTSYLADLPVSWETVEDPNAADKVRRAFELILSDTPECPILTFDGFASARQDEFVDDEMKPN